MARQTITEFRINNEAGNEREAIRHVAVALSSHSVNPAQMERIKTAVSEAALNAMEHGNRGSSNDQVKISIEIDDALILISVSDKGGMHTIPTMPVEPDLAAKLAGEQQPRGWGLFLIRNMVDALEVQNQPGQRCLRLMFNRL